MRRPRKSDATRLGVHGDGAAPAPDRREHGRLTLLGALVMAAFAVVVVPQLLAQGDASGIPGPTADTGAGGKAHKRPAIDPFKTLIIPKVDVTIAPTFAPPKPLGEPAPIVIPPVQYNVNAIGDEKGEKIALLDFSGQTYIVRKGDKVPPDTDSPAFIVKDIKDRKVEVFDFKAQRPVVKELPED